jgi:hypothetical protein
MTRTKVVASSLSARSSPASSTQLLLRILDRPDLVAAVRELPAPALASLIDRVGLEDAGELVALASSEQLLGVFDHDLWRAAAPGEDETFQPERFALWLEILFEGGEDRLVERLCALPRDLLTLALERLVLVVDTDAFWQGFAEPSREQQGLEAALDAPLFEEWEEFRLLARDPMHWDVVWAALLGLDRDHHALLRAILEQCCALSTEYIEEHGGLLAVLTSAQMLEGDVAGEREDRRAAEGFVAPADARSFLALARLGDRLETRDPITKAYFRARAGGESARPTLASGPPAAKYLDRQPATDRSQQAVEERPALLLRAALGQLRLADPDVFSQRVEELGYLANVLVAGSSGRRPRPVEALERAIAVCNAGLALEPRAGRSLSHAVDLLRATPADRLFRRGYLSWLDSEDRTARST